MDCYLDFWNLTFAYIQDYLYQFNSITDKAGYRFENQLWVEQQKAVKERLDALSDLHDKVNRLLAKERFSKEDVKFLKTSLTQCSIPNQLKDGFYTLAAEVLRRLGEMNFTLSEDDTNNFDSITSNVSGPCDEILLTIFQNLPWSWKIDEIDLLVKMVARKMQEQFDNILSITYYPHLFYRNQHAYLMAVVNTRQGSFPFILPFVNSNRITCDAVIAGETALVQVFSFSRSYFQVSCPHPNLLIKFLHHWMPTKPKAQLLINLGYIDWGKYVMLSDLLQQQNMSSEKFDFAPGIRGLVMIVFTFPQSNLVIKLIRDTPKPPKDTAKEDVIAKYNLVSTLDRAGRVADAQRYYRIDFPIDSFSKELLKELLEQAPSSCHQEGDKLVLSDVYLERKLIPMNLYLEQRPEIEKEIIMDYGRAIEEMASTNLFPGDLLIKNFGISQEQRVIFYDYDEVCRVTQCEFLELPGNWEEEDVTQNLVVYPNQIFPQEFPKFLLPSSKRHLLTDHFHYLFQPHFWREVQARIKSSVIMDHAPYRPNL